MFTLKRGHTTGVFCKLCQNIGKCVHHSTSVLVLFIHTCIPCHTQACSSPDGQNVQMMLLSLAEKLMDKYVEDKRVDAEAGYFHFNYLSPMSS